MRRRNGIARAIGAGLAAIALASTFPAASAGNDKPKPGAVSRPLYFTEAPIVMLKDLDSGAILFSRGADKRFAPASMAKVMTAYVVLDLIKRGDIKANVKLQPGDVIIIPESMF